VSCLSWGSVPREALTTKRVRRYRLRRPSSSSGFDRFHRRVHAGSADPETSQGVSSRTLRFSPFRRASRMVSSGSPASSGFRPLQSSPRFQRRGLRSATPLFGFVPLRRFRSARLYPGCHAGAPAPAGFPDPHGAFVSAPGLPGLFHPGPSVGFTPSRPFPPPDRANLSVRRQPSRRFSFGV